MNNEIIVQVLGVAGSGKSTVAQLIRDCLANYSAYLDHDQKFNVVLEGEELSRQSHAQRLNALLRTGVNVTVVERNVPPEAGVPASSVLATSYPAEPPEVEKNMMGGVWVNATHVPVPANARVLVTLRGVCEADYLKVGTEVRKSRDWPWQVGELVRRVSKPGVVSEVVEASDVGVRLVVRKPDMLADGRVFFRTHAEMRRDYERFTPADDSPADA